MVDLEIKIDMIGFILKDIKYSLLFGSISTLSFFLKIQFVDLFTLF